MTWRIHLFGRPALTQGDHTITHFESDRAAALLAYLALHPRHPHPREELIELLWPDCDLERGRPRLRQTLYSLRGLLEPAGTPPGSVLVADRQSVSLDASAFTCDVTEFEAMLRDNRYGEARALYVGELLPGFYDDWILAERRRFALLAETLQHSTLSDPALQEKAETEPTGNGVTSYAQPTQLQPYVFLPGYLTAFFGRVEDRETLRVCLKSKRLVTITGLGGVGKTRLAVATAREAAPEFSLVAFVSLADCVAAGQLPDAIRAALLLPTSPAPVLDAIIGALSGRKTLLVLDNFEQLVNADGVTLVEELLTHLPELTCLVTSRRLLGIVGEQEFNLAPLPIPSNVHSLNDAVQNPSVALFLDRTQSARPGYRLTESNRDDIVALCRALEGVPLALELAAARIRTRTPSEMRNQIESRFQWLTRSGPNAEKEGRQRSLDAALEWSWRLLPPDQQHFLASLSLFRGGWTAGSAEEVSELTEARERLESLIAASLITSREAQDGTTRFDMLEMVRNWAHVRLDDASRDILAQRHARWFMAFAEKHGDNLGNADSRHRVALLSAENDNLRAAMQWSLDTQQPEIGLRIAASLGRFWHVCGHIQEGSDWLERLLDAADPAPTALRGKAASWAGHLACLAYNSSLATMRHEEGLAIRHAIQDTHGIAEAFNGLGVLHFYDGGCAESMSYWEQSLALFQQVGDTRMTARLLFNLAVGYEALGQHERCDVLLAESLALWRTLGPTDGLLHCLVSLYWNAFTRGDRFCGYAYWIEALHLSQTLGDMRGLTDSLERLAIRLVMDHHENAAARLLGFAARQRETLFPPLEPRKINEYEPALHDLRTALGEAVFAELWQMGRSLSEEEIIAEAVAEAQRAGEKAQNA